MSSLPKVAVAGAGNVGIPIINALISSDRYAVTVLSRSLDASTKYADKIPSSPDLTYVVVDYSSVSSLTEALTGHHAVVSTIGSTSISEQKPLIEASVAAKVQRFLPSEFGSDTVNPNTAKLPIFFGKIAISKLLDDLAKEHTDFSYTNIMTGPFFDWGLAQGLLPDVKNRTITRYNGGDGRFTTTNVASIAKAVVGVLDNLEATKNRYVKVYGTVITQNKIMAIAEKIDGRKWTVKEADLADVRKEAQVKLENANGDHGQIFGAMVMFLMPAVFGGDDYGCDFTTGKTDNELLGVPVMSEKEVEELIARFV